MCRSISKRLATSRPTRRSACARRSPASHRSAVPRRRLGQEGRPAVHDRPAAYQAQLEQAQANLTRDEALLSQAEAQLARDEANADYMQLTAQRNGELVERGIVSKDIAAAVARPRPTRRPGHGEGRRGGGRERQGAARRAAGRGRQRPGAAGLHHRSARRSTAAPAT